MIFDRLQELSQYILNENQQLIPLSRIPLSSSKADVAAIIINRGRPDLTGLMIRHLKNAGNQLKIGIFVINIGPEKDHFNPIYSFCCESEDFHGECFGYNLGLRLARCKGNYRYYWLTSNRIALGAGIDTVEELVRLADANAKTAVLYPTPINNGGKKQDQPGEIYPVVSGPYSALLARAQAIEDAGFFNPAFKYNIGAVEEFSFKLYSKGWQMAGTDRVKVKYVNDIENRFGQNQDLCKAKEFAARYFVEHYGINWDEEFSNILPAGIKTDSYTQHRREWERVLDEKERESYNAQKSPGSTLKQQIEALHPWYYEVMIGNIKVIPGRGSKQTAEELRGRVEYRSRLIVDEVVKRYDFHDKRLLDIAANCGYWSARYAEMGASSLLAVEGRFNYVKQGRLYWDNNPFVKKGAYEFIRGNVMDVEVWRKIKEKQPFDFTLCTGILYHIPDYEKVVRFIVSVTKEAILIDSRISGNSSFVEEPGGWCFDAIIETRTKRVPNLNHLVNLLDTLGFRTETLSVEGPTPAGLKGKDDYTKGKRVALLAMRSL